MKEALKASKEGKGRLGGYMRGRNSHKLTHWVLSPLSSAQDRHDEIRIAAAHDHIKSKNWRGASLDDQEKVAELDLGDEHAMW